MGLRGIPVITNVIELPNTIPFTTVKDIEQAIKMVDIHIGTTDSYLSGHVKNAVICDNMDGFDLELLNKYEHTP